MAGLPEIASLREERKASDFRAQQTLAAVHETLEKVVDRLATLEGDVNEARTGERAPRKSAPMASSPFDHDSFLVEPGGGRPDAAFAVPSSQASHQASYIDVARRAIAARAAAEQAADQPEAEQHKRAKAGEADAFPRRLAAANAGRRLPALLAMAGAVLILGVWQTYRLFDMTPPPPIASAAISSAKPGDDLHPPTVKSLLNQATAAQSPAAQTPAADATALPPGGLAPAPATGPVTGAGAGLGAGQGVDPLAVGTIKPREVQMALLKRMAYKGDSAAQFDMGARLVDGRGLARDPAAAIGWFEKAAAQGLVQAQFRLGGIYEKGLGVARDAAKARECYEKAAARDMCARCIISR